MRPTAGRTVLRRPGRGPGPHAGSRAPERRQPAPDQLLPLAAARPRDRPADGERRAAVLSPPRALQRAARRAAGTTAPKPPRCSTTSIAPASTGSAGSTRGEFNVPFGRYARIGYTRDFTAYRDALRALDVHRAATSSASRSSQTTSSTPTRPTTSSSRSYSKGGFSLGRPGAHRRMAGAHAARSCS